jgi:hypothetical protein
VYPPGHWAHKRSRCPACGALLEAWSGEREHEKYEHYDSSVDVKFDLTDLLSPDQRKEARNIGLIGGSLILVAGIARILFVVLGRLEGFWKVPLWFDVIVGVMVLMGTVSLVWCLRRLLAHRRALSRRD